LTLRTDSIPSLTQPASSQQIHPLATDKPIKHRIWCSGRCSDVRSSIRAILEGLELWKPRLHIHIHHTDTKVEHDPQFLK